MATQALILAAGRGTRLGPSSKGTPKPLLQVGRRTLIEHQLETLARADVGPVAMVVGYCAYEVQEFVGPQVEYLHNTNWASTNSLYSFLQARSWVQGDLMVLNCDILLDPEILDRLLDHGGDCLAYDSGSGTGREQMKVQVEGGHVVGMSKTLDAERVSGENVGVLYLKHDTVQEMFRCADALLQQGERKAWIGAALEQVARQRPIAAVDIAGLPWGEIDYNYDLEQARRHVWPAIRQRHRWRRPNAQLRRWAISLVWLILMATALGAMLHQPEPITVEWETLVSTGARPARIQVRDLPQDWYVLDGPEQIMTSSLRGPATLRVETRLLIAGASEGPLPYAIAVRWDDGAEEWHALATRPSGSARWEEHTLGKRERETLPIPDGLHRLSVRLVAPDDAQCLVRLRQSDREAGD